VAAGTLTPGELRAVAAARVLVPGAVVTGRSAAVLWGVPVAERDDDVELTILPGSAFCSAAGIRVRRRALDPGLVTARRGTRVTTGEATAIDLARVGPLDDAVVLIDRLVAERATSLAWVRAAAAQASGRGCRQVRLAAELADGLAGSPQETRLRLLLHRSGLPRPVAQFEVRDADGHAGRVDLAWPHAKVIVEYEGRWHGENPQRVAKDRHRLNRLTAAGWTVVFVTAPDLHRPEQVAAGPRRWRGASSRRRRRPR
jgi:hypothetical protein